MLPDGNQAKAHLSFTIRCANMHNDAAVAALMGATRMRSLVARAANPDSLLTLPEPTSGWYV